MTVQINAQRHEDRFVYYLLVLANFEEDAIQINNGVDFIKWTGLLLHNSVYHAVSDFRD